MAKTKFEVWKSKMRLQKFFGEKCFANYPKDTPEQVVYSLYECWDGAKPKIPPIKPERGTRFFEKPRGSKSP